MREKIDIFDYFTKKVMSKDTIKKYKGKPICEKNMCNPYNGLIHKPVKNSYKSKY